MSTGRPLGFDPETAVEAATQVFWSQGYAASSLPDLLGATGLSRSSLYQRFGGKQSLFEHCLDHYGRTMEAQLRAALDAAPDGRTFIAGLLEQVIAEGEGASPPRGCLVFNSASEFGQGDPAVAARVRDNLARFRRVFVTALEQDRDGGRLAADAPVQALADFLVTGLSGLRTMVKAGTPYPTLRRTRELLLQALD